MDQYRKENPDYTGPIPADAVTASASGLDPHISPANAEIQVARVARKAVDSLAVRSPNRPRMGSNGGGA